MRGQRLQRVVGKDRHGRQRHGTVEHVFPFPAGTIVYRSGPLMASAAAFDEGERKKIQQRVQSIATHYAEAWGATAKVTFGVEYPVTKNDPALTERMVPTLKRVPRTSATSSRTCPGCSSPTRPRCRWACGP